MPVPEQIPHITYTTDGRTTDFPLTFDCPDQAHLIVSLDDVEVEIGQWALSNSNVVFNSPPTSNSVLSIERSTPLKRTRNYETNNNSFRPGPLNRDFDSIWRKLQELGYRDSVLLAKLIQEINTRIRDDKAFNSKVSAIDTRVSENEIDIAILSEKLAKEILQRTQADRKLKSLIYGMLDEAINEGTVNALAVIHVDSVDELSYVQAWDGRTVYVKNDGEYYYSDAIGDWIKDSSFMSYDFKTEQPIQAYYDLLGNWDDAIYLAQKNVVALGYSPKLRFPSGTIILNRPILGGASLGDKLNTDYPELGMKDSNGIFLKSFPTQLYGSAQPPYSTQGSAINGTSIVFSGCKSQTDLTYMNYGVVHFGPTNPLDFANQFETKQDTWGYANLIVKDLSLTTKNQDGTEFGTIHGIFMYRHHWHHIENVQLDAFYGAGILGNWVFDSNLDRIVYTRCGRMSPNINDYQKDGNFSIEYQTYAPLHLMCTNIGDTTNFIKSYRGHFENNYRVVADVIISNATPIWFQEHHHESGPGLIADSKVALATNYGVQYPCQDSESRFDYKKFTKATGSSVIIANNITGYTKNYRYACILNKYTTINACTWRFNSDVLLQGGNTNCILTAAQSLFKNMDLSATFADKSLNLTDCDLSGDLSLNYFGALSLNNVDIAGNFIVNNMYKTSQSSLRNVSANLFSGDLGNVVGDIKQNSITESSNIQASQGVVEYRNIDTILARI
ncbi:hypothetical protein [Acinetobacter pollinis]|uniref:Uncharacterized protein n=1 Tax=Acinetobacter pollinis TaxID=2605270 RepID=A0ABU6DV40_9GAMM|nr:hypothetical protein [Acinetobacter pollinis]MEB5477263.1 hypothetical protein [Acinetobacter pollinis]